MLPDDRQYPAGSDFLGAAGACGCGDGGHVPQHGRPDGPGQPFHHRTELGHDRVYQRHETHQAYNMGSKSFQKFSSAIHEENAMWNETSRRMGPPYAAFVVIIECGMLLMVPLGGMFFLKGSLTASAFLLFIYVGPCT